MLLPAPEPVVRALVAKDEQETHDDGQSGHDAHGKVEVQVRVAVEIDNQRCPECMYEERQDNVAMDGAFDKAEDQGHASGLVAGTIRQGECWPAMVIACHGVLAGRVPRMRSRWQTLEGYFVQDDATTLTTTITIYLCL